MKNKKNKSMINAIWLLTILVQLALIAYPAKALIYWTNKDGSASFFDWHNGGSDKGLFGSPTMVGESTFMFFPSNFRAESINGIPAIKSDRLEFTLTAHQDYTITGIRITEYGDYGILDTGKVSVSGTMFVTNLDVSPLQVHWGNFLSTPTSPMTTGLGEWSAQAVVTDVNCANLKIVLNNNLMAISSPGSTSFIEKKIVGGSVAIEFLVEGQQVPEPATIAIFGLGGLAVFRKKKH